MVAAAPNPPPRRRSHPLLWITAAAVATVAMAVGAATCGPGLSRGRGQIVGSGRDRVGVVEVVGPITDTTETIRQLRAFAERDDLLALVVRVDSPGGAVAPSQELYVAMREAAASKPVVTSMGNIAASGGLWIALGADEIFASAGSITGSIGVITQIPDLRGVAEALKLDMRTYKSGAVKDLGNPLRQVSPEDEAVFLGLIADVYDQFVTLVAQRRNLPRAHVVSFADGRVVSGRTAKALGLVDELGGLYAAARRARKLAKIRAAEEGREPVDDEEAGEPSLVYPDKPMPSFFELLTQSAAESVFRGLAAGFDHAADRFARPQVDVELR